MTTMTVGTTRSAIDMINDCFRHQHPEAYGREEVGAAVVPPTLRYGRDEIGSLPSEAIPEEEMGRPDAVPLGDARGTPF